MSKRRNREKQLAELVVAEGLRIESMRLSGSGHVRIEVTNRQGKRKLVFASSTPSDYRADRNLRALLRRMAADDS